MTAYVTWLSAHAIGGALFALAIRSIPLTDWWTFPIHGLVAGVVFGAVQILVLEFFFHGMRWWLVTTVVASPISWFIGVIFGTATLLSGGWLGGAVSAIAQMVVLTLRFRQDRHVVRIALAWFMVALLGAIPFYFFYLLAMFNYANVSLSFGLLVAGTVGYAIVSGLVVAALAGRAVVPGPVPSRA
jgi:hypothetical protein